MIHIWITGLLLLAQPSEPSDSLAITQQGRTIATVHREDFTMPLPGTPMIDHEKYRKFIKRLDQQIYREPINAKLNDQGIIIPGKWVTDFINRRLRRNFMPISLVMAHPK